MLVVELIDLLCKDVMSIFHDSVTRPVTIHPYYWVHPTGTLNRSFDSTESFMLKNINTDLCPYFTLRGSVTLLYQWDVNYRVPRRPLSYRRFRM